MENENKVCVDIIPKVLRYIEASDELFSTKRWLDVKEHECIEHEINSSCKIGSDYINENRIVMMMQNVHDMRREITEELKKLD